MRPAKNASRPASTAFFMADAIKTGFCAPAMAVFIKIPAQPNSIAMAASLAVPTPASTNTGTFAFSIIICRFHGFNMPMPEPMSEASGMTAQQPISSSCLAIIGSSDVYTITSKPSFTKVFAAAMVSITFGYKVFGSPNTSSFTSLWPSNNSLANLKVRTASSAE